jgi:S1-C subfamily serine protease
MQSPLMLVAAAVILCCLVSPVAADEPPGLEPLIRFHDQVNQQHRYSIRRDEAEAWKQLSGIHLEHPIGRVSSRQLAGTQRLHRAISADGRTHMYFTGDPNAVPGAVSYNTNFEAYVWTEPGDGRIPIYFNTLRSGGDQYYSYILEHVRLYAHDSPSGRARQRNPFSDTSIAFWAYPPLPEQFANAISDSNNRTPEPIVTKAVPTNSVPQTTPIESAKVTRTDDDDVVFREVSLDHSVTDLALSDDGLWLAIAHQFGDSITVFDVLNQRVAKTFHADAPRDVAFQGDRLFVANYGMGTVGVHSVADGWTLTDQLRVPSKNIVYISIPQAGENRNSLLVTCHGEGREGSYQDCHNYIVDVSRDRSERVSDRSLLVASRDGRYIRAVDSFGLSNAGSFRGYSWSDYIDNEAEAKSLFACNVTDATFVAESIKRGWWVSPTHIYSGSPLKPLNKKPYKLAIADASVPLMYVVDEDVVRAVQLNTSLSEIDAKRVQFPFETKHFASATNWRERTREYLLDLPCAVTHDSKLHLFFVSVKDGKLYSARTSAFAPSAEGSLEADSDADGIGEEANKTSSSSLPEKNPGAVPSDFDSRLLHEQIEALIPKYLAADETILIDLSALQKDGIRFHVGAPEMQLSKEGQLSWRIAASPLGPTELKLRVESVKGTEFMRFDSEIVHPELLREVGGDWQKLKRHGRLDLDVPSASLRLSHDRSTLMLLCEDRMQLLSKNGRTIDEEFALPRTYQFVDLRGEFILGVSAQTFDILRRTDQSIVRSIDLSRVGFTVEEVTDLALQSTTAVSYICVKVKGIQPRYQLVKIDEQEGTAVAMEVPARWVRVSPDESLLYVGYGDSVRRGVEFHWNPGGGLAAIPKHGTIDFLAQFQVRDTTLRFEQGIMGPGIAGKGLRLSSGGNRLVYLSNGGDSRRRGQVLSLNCNDFEKNPVWYATSGPPATHHLCFHPNLTIAAIPNKETPVLYNAATGQPLDGRLLTTTSRYIDVEVKGLEFAPDGKHLVMLCGDKEGLFVESTSIRWHEDDLKLEEIRLDSQERSLIAFEPVPLGEFQALQSPPAEPIPLTAKEIGRRFLPAVVSVHAGNSIGSGFFVGSSGYLLTNAHVVEEEGSIEVVITAEGKRTACPAKLIRRNISMDIALLRAEVPGVVPVVSLATEPTAETGEAVVVIGSPALADAVLEQTMTTGIVSNPSRLLGGDPFLQTSAAINPGNSGGPVFDSRGIVIGMVTLKGNIEGTGFAIVAASLRQFLESTQQRTSGSGAEEAYRTFKDQSGKLSVEARVREVVDSGTAVVLERRDGKLVKVPVDKLSREDQDYLSQLEQRNNFVPEVPSQ